ncbi:MAG: dTMP kinase [Xanthomonadaceae bacterium]|nr:dTMP kinase [Xanthomonadaceae bacterium]
METELEAELSAHRGRFIVVEGIEGAGKSTHITHIVNYIRAEGREVVATREPGGTALGESIRELVLAPSKEPMSPEAEVLLMFAARAQHIEDVIEPALGRGAWVVCDRFTDATYAYQGGGRDMPLSRIAALEDWVQGALRPDLTLLLDVDPEVGLKRVGERGGKDRFDQENVEFFAKVREVYLRRATLDRHRYAIINADQEIGKVRQGIASALDPLLATKADG